MIFDQKYFTCLSTKFEFNNTEDKEILLKLIKDYNSVVNYFYNRICEKEGKLSRIEAFNLESLFCKTKLYYIWLQEEAKFHFKVIYPDDILQRSKTRCFIIHFSMKFLTV